MIDLWHFIAHVGGIDDVSGPWYGFWSGIGSDLGELALLFGAVTLYRKHNCHVKGCLRLGNHPVDNTPYVVCGKHHPEVPEKVTSEHVLVSYQKANSRNG